MFKIPYINVNTLDALILAPWAIFHWGLNKFNLLGY